MPLNKKKIQCNIAYMLSYKGPWIKGKGSPKGPWEEIALYVLISQRSASISLSIYLLSVDVVNL